MGFTLGFFFGVICMLLAVLAGSSQWLAVGLGVGVVLGSAVGFLGDMGIGTYILGLTYMSTQLKMMFGFSGSGLHPNEVLKEQELQKVLRKCMLRMERIVSSCTRLHPSRLGKNPPPHRRRHRQAAGEGEFWRQGSNCVRNAAHTLAVLVL